MNHARAHEFDVRRNYIIPSDTRASLGHKLGAAAHREKVEGAESRGSWKMSKFAKVQSKVAQNMSGSGAGGAVDVEKFD